MEAAAEKSRSATVLDLQAHRPVIIYARLPAGGTYYPISMFPTNGECLIGISSAFFAFCLRVYVILPTCSLYPQQKRAYSALHPQDLCIQPHACRHILSAVPWISEDRLLQKACNCLKRICCFTLCLVSRPS